MFSHWIHRGGNILYTYGSVYTIIIRFQFLNMGKYVYLWIIFCLRESPIGTLKQNCKGKNLENVRKCLSYFCCYCNKYVIRRGGGLLCMVSVGLTWGSCEGLKDILPIQPLPPCY